MNWRCFFGRHELRSTGWHRVVITLHSSQAVCARCGARFYVDHYSGRGTRRWTIMDETERSAGPHGFWYRGDAEPKPVYHIYEQIGQHERPPYGEPQRPVEERAQ